MRKKCKRIVRRALAPTLVALSVSPEAEMSERLALAGVEAGWATPAQFNCLLDCADLLLLAATEKNDNGCAEVAQHARAALADIADRYQADKTLKAGPEEMNVLNCLVDVSEDFWKRKSGALFADSYRALDKYRAYQKEQAA